MFLIAGVLGTESFRERCWNLVRYESTQEGHIKRCLSALSISGEIERNIYVCDGGVD